MFLKVIVKSTVAPWSENLILTDAFRGPLAESFKLVELVHNYQHSNRYKKLYMMKNKYCQNMWLFHLGFIISLRFFSSHSLDKVCLNIESVKNKNNKITNIFPEYTCLLLSPVNLWHQDFNKFQLDANLVNTIYNYQIVSIINPNEY